MSVRRFRAAAVQMSSTADKQDNLRAATALVEQAARSGAQLIVLPELFACLGGSSAMARAAEDVPGPTSDALAALAARTGTTLVAGSIPERNRGGEHFFNTSLVFAPDGTLLSRYRKVHLFDVDLPGQVTLQESSYIAAGSDVVVAQTALARIGQAICYDLRFPELFRQLIDVGAELFAIASAFSRPTGRDHWEVLLRARAIENQVYVVAPNQCGRHTPQLTTYGHSMIIDPWGVSLGTANEQPGVVVAEIDMDRQDEVRCTLPALAHRRSLKRA